MSINLSSNTEEEAVRQQAADPSHHYSTINSQKSLFSLDIQMSAFLQGQILFDDRKQRLRLSNYIRISADADIDEVVKYIALKWLKRNPKIILSIITGLYHFKTYKNQKQLNKFKRGIIKAAYSTELIYVTNGYNIGVTKLIGDAFREESLARRGCTEGLQIFSNSNDTNNTESELDKLMLIGIVSTSNLKNADLFKGAQVKREAIYKQFIIYIVNTMMMQSFSI